MTYSTSLTIRLAREDDRASLATLAQLDSGRAPPHPVPLAVAGALMLAVLRVRRGPLRITRRQLVSAAIVGTLLAAGGNGLVTVAEQDVPSSLAALLIASVPLWVVVLRALLGEHPGRATFA